MSKKPNVETIRDIAEKICAFNRELWEITNEGAVPPNMTEEEILQWRISMMKKHEETITIDHAGKIVLEK